MHFSVLHALGQQVRGLLEAALLVLPPGGQSTAWASILQTYGVTPSEISAGLAEAYAHKQTKGAPLSQVAACLEQLKKQALEHMHKEQDANEITALARLVEEGIACYLQEACKKQSGLFANVKKTALKHQYDAHKAAQSFVLLCPTCGGPRLLKESLVCAYCGSHFSEANS